MPQLPAQPNMRPIMAARVAGAYKNPALMGKRPTPVASPTSPPTAAANKPPGPAVAAVAPPAASTPTVPAGLRNPTYSPPAGDLKPIELTIQTPGSRAALLPKLLPVAGPPPLARHALQTFSLPPDKPVVSAENAKILALQQARAIMDSLQATMGILHRRGEHNTEEYKQLVEQYKRLSVIVKEAQPAPVLQPPTAVSP